MKPLAWIVARLWEASTWAGFAASSVAAYALPYPWNWLVASFGCMAVILKGGDGAGK